MSQWMEMGGGWHLIPIRLIRPGRASSPETDEQMGGCLAGGEGGVGENSREAVVREGVGGAWVLSWAAGCEG